MLEIKKRLNKEKKKKSFKNATKRFEKNEKYIDQS